MRSSPKGLQVGVAAIFDNVSRPQYAGDVFLDNYPVLYSRSVTVVPPHIKAAADKVVLVLAWDA